MSFLDRIAAAVTPAASDEDRQQARNEALQLSNADDWLGQIIEHHRAIENAFADAKAAIGEPQRIEAMKALGALLTGHSIAEEVVVYPAVIEHSGKTHGTMAYEEQSMAKVQMAMLEQIDPSSQEWIEKLEHIEGAVAQHVYQEESEWFPDVAKNAPADIQALLSQRYREEYQRYFG